MTATAAQAEHCRCPSCSRRVAFSTAQAGKKARCACRAVFQLPHPTGAMFTTPNPRAGAARHTPAVAPWCRPAVWFDTVTKVPVEPKAAGMPRLPMRFARGCVDAWVRGVAAKLVTTRLFAEHDSTRELASSVGGNLTLHADQDALWVSLAHPPAAVRELEKSLPALSVGHVPTKWRVDRDEHGPVITVTEDAVLEISLVAEGLFPGTGVGLDVIRRDALAALRNARR